MAMPLTSTEATICAQTERRGPQKTHALETGASETLRVVPVQKRFRFMSAAKATWTEVSCSTINLHLEGNWMPLMVGSYTTGIAIPEHAFAFEDPAPLPHLHAISRRPLAYAQCIYVSATRTAARAGLGIRIRAYANQMSQALTRPPCRRTCR